MAKEPAYVYVKGKQLRCPVCEHDRFTTHSAVMAPRGLAFLDWEWMGRKAENHACSSCGYVFWFVKPKG